MPITDLIRNDLMEYTLIRSDRKSIAIELKNSQEIIVRAPRRMPDAKIRAFLREKTEWILAAQERLSIREAENAGREELSASDIKKLRKLAKEIIPVRVSHYANLLGVTYGRIAIRTQRSRWGSCSTKGNLNFNCLLMRAPFEVIDSVVVHELCHRIEMNHSKRFYDLVHSVFPEYDKWHGWLKKNGNSLMYK